VDDYPIIQENVKHWPPPPSPLHPALHSNYPLHPPAAAAVAAAVAVVAPAAATAVTAVARAVVARAAVIAAVAVAICVPHHVSGVRLRTSVLRGGSGG
jgi:hypothetical protein